MSKLHLALKAEYFDAIRNGSKTEEYRLDNAFWQKRLLIGGTRGVLARSFDAIVVTKGYPKRGDPERTMEFPWLGWSRRSITHPHFGDQAVSVFAIRVGRAALSEAQEGRK